MNKSNVYEWKIIVGIATITATIILLGWIAINENGRMEAFTARAEGRSIENGARLFEANCAACHGFDGRGLPGRGPALNNPHLFGYNYFGDLPNQLIAVQAELNNTPETAENYPELLAQEALLLSQLQARQEELLYDWSDMIGAADPDLACATASGELDPITGYSERQLCEMGQLGVDLMLFDQRTAERLETYPAEALVSAYPIPTQSAQLADLFEERDALLAQETLTAAQRQELAGIRAQISELLAPNLPIIVGRMADEAGLSDLEAEQASLDALDELTAEQEERLAAIEDELEQIDVTLSPLEDVVSDRRALQDEFTRFENVVSAQRNVEQLRAELARVESDLAALEPAPETGADPNAVRREELTTTATQLQADLDAALTARDEAYQTLVDREDIVDYRFMFEDQDAGGDWNLTRLEQVEWSGSLYDFVEGTLIGGRPTSANYWNEPMANWAQSTGGPLRGDQIQNLARFIMNWNRDFTVADLRAVRQFARVPGAGGAALADDAVVPTDDPQLAHSLWLELVAGDFEPDPAIGEQLFAGATYGCLGCHNGVVGPEVSGLYARVTNNVDDRLTATGYLEQPDMYLVESIVQPNAFIAPPYAAGVMPGTFGESMPIEDFAHIMAYLQEQD